MKIAKILFILAATPFLSGRGGVVAAPHPPPQLFLRQKNVEFFFIDTWVSGQRMGKKTKWQS